MGCGRAAGLGQLDPCQRMIAAPKGRENATRPSAPRGRQGRTRPPWAPGNRREPSLVWTWPARLGKGTMGALAPDTGHYATRMQADGGTRPGLWGATSSRPSHQRPGHGGAHLILIGLLLPADGDGAGAHAHVHLVVAGEAPAALRGRADPLELQLGVPAELPGLPRCGEHVHPPEEIHRPQRGAGHGGGLRGSRRQRARVSAPGPRGPPGQAGPTYPRGGLRPHTADECSPRKSEAEPRFHSRARFCSLPSWPSDDGDFF